MTPEDFQKALAKALGLTETATAEEILAAFTKKLKASPAAAEDAGETKALSAGFEEIKALLKKQDEKITAQDEKLKLLSSGVETNERHAILSAAAREGKVVPATAAKSLPVDQLKTLCAELPVTVPMDARTANETTLLLSSTHTPAEVDGISKLTGVTAEQRAKHKDR